MHEEAGRSLVPEERREKTGEGFHSHFNLGKCKESEKHEEILKTERIGMGRGSKLIMIF